MKWFPIGSSRPRGCAFYRNNKITIYFARSPVEGASSLKSPLQYAAWRVCKEEKIGIRIYNIKELLRRNEAQWFNLQYLGGYFGLIRQDLAEEARVGKLPLRGYFLELQFINELQREAAGYRFSMPADLPKRAPA